MSAPHARALALHERILAAHAALRRSERDLARLLATLAHEGLHLDLGYASVPAYAAAVLDLPARQARALVQIGRRLPELPALDAAMAAGDVGWTKAREVVRVATPDTEAAWVEAAVAATSRDLERLVAAASVGEAPPARAPLAPMRQRLVFEVDSQDADLVRAAIAMLRAAAGVERHDVDDGALLAELARRVLHDAAPDEAPSAERYRTVLVHCPTCAVTTGMEAEVSEAHVGHAACDGELMDGRPGPSQGHVTRTIPPATRRAVLHRDRHRCAVPGCRNRLWVDVHHVVERHRGGDHRPGNLVTLCTVHHRLVHDGLLAVRHTADGLRFELGDGRVLLAPRPHALPAPVASQESAPS